MAIFGFGKKVVLDTGARPVTVSQAEPTDHVSNQSQQAVGSGVQVLGSGCAKCNQLEAAAVAALEELGMNAAIEHVRDYAQIAAYGVMSTPALVVDGKVVSFGKVLSKDEVVRLIRTVRC